MKRAKVTKKVSNKTGNKIENEPISISCYPIDINLPLIYENPSTDMV